MTAKPFIDTNVLVYGFSDLDPRKRKAVDLLAAGGIISVQVVNEFVDVARRKLGRDWAAVEMALDTIRSLLDPPVPLSVEVHRAALTLSRRHGLRISDGLILSAARLAGCTLLYTEDLNDGQVIEGVTVRNPFLSA